MNGDIEVLKKQLEDMGGILNAVLGQKFECKSEQTLLIIQRRMEESELLAHLKTFTGLFSKEDEPTVMELSNAAVAFVKIKTLVEAGKTDFDAVTIRALIKEFNVQKVKVENIIVLSRLNVQAAEDFQKEAIEKTMSKCEAYLKAFESEIADAEKKIEADIEYIELEDEEPEEKVPDTKPVKEKPVREKVKKERPRSEGAGFVKEMLDKAKKSLEGMKRKKEVNTLLKEEEAKHSDSGCSEIPYYEESLKFTDSFICKDIPEFSVMLKKDRAFFGKTQNIKGGSYDNHDQSLLELMNAGSDLIQFLTTDLLSGEYDLKPFTKEEKKAMRLYFGFVCVCFEKHIGKVLTVKEYLGFKDYYNRLILKMLELEEKDREKYYKALLLAEKYVSYMEGYDLKVSDDKDSIAENILSGKSLNYVGDLKLILETHVVSKEAADKLTALIESLGSFEDEPAREEERVSFDTASDNSLQDARIIVEFLSDAGAVTDEAAFSGRNIERAVADYLKAGNRARIGVDRNGTKSFLFGLDNSISKPLDIAASEEDKEFLDAASKSLSELIIRNGGKIS